MNSLSSYCGLVDAKIIASDKDLPVLHQKIIQPTDISIDDSLTCLLAWIQVLTCDASNWHNGFKSFWKEHTCTLQDFIHLLHEFGQGTLIVTLFILYHLNSGVIQYRLGDV